MAVVSGLWGRQTGETTPHSFCRRIGGARVQSLAIGAASPVVLASTRCAVTALEADTVHQRFLLAASARGHLRLFDLESGPAPAPATPGDDVIEISDSDDGAGPGELPAARGAMRRQAVERERERSGRERSERERLARGYAAGGGQGGGLGMTAFASSAASWPAALGAATHMRLAPMAVASMTSSGAEGRAASRAVGRAPAVTAAAWYGLDSGMAVTGSADGALVAWDVGRGLEAAARLGVSVASAAGQDDDGGSRAAVHCLAMHPAAGAGALTTTLAVGRESGPLRLLDLRSGGNTHALSGHSGAVLGAAWQPQRPHELASGGSDGRVLVWDVRLDGSRAVLGAMDWIAQKPGLGGGGDDSAPVMRRRGHSAAATAVAWGLADGGGAFLLSAGCDGAVRRWRVETGWSEGGAFAGLANSARRGTRLAVVPAASGTAGAGACVFHGSSAATGARQGHADLVGGAAEDEGGSFGDGVVCWDERTGSRLGRLSGAHLGGITCLTARGTAHDLATGGSDGSIVLWRPEFLLSGRDETVDTASGRSGPADPVAQAARAAFGVGAGEVSEEDSDSGSDWGGLGQGNEADVAEAAAMALANSRARRLGHGARRPPG